MAVDLYAGTLSRYHSGSWETILQQHAKVDGVPVIVIRPNASDDPPASMEDVRTVVLNWRSTLQGHLEIPFDWNEADEMPYFTDRPGWEGCAALWLWAAYAENPHLARPNRIPVKWNEDPAHRASAAEDFETKFPDLLKNVELWLPLGERIIFKYTDICGNDIVIGTVAGVRKDLELLNSMTWRADDATISNWSRNEFEDRSLENEARLGFSIYWELSNQASMHNLPMKLDY